MGSSKFSVASKTKGITIKSYYFDRETGRKVLEYAQDAMSIFNECFGKYPYKTYSVVAADFCGRNGVSKSCFNKQRVI